MCCGFILYYCTCPAHVFLFPTVNVLCVHVCMLVNLLQLKILSLVCTCPLKFGSVFFLRISMGAGISAELGLKEIEVR